MYLLLIHGGHCTGLTQVNDLWLHGEMERCLQHFEELEYHKQALMRPNSVPSMSRQAVLTNAVTYWQHGVDHAKSIAWSKRAGLSLQLDGSEAVGKEVRPFWVDLDMDAKRLAAIRAIDQDIEAGLLTEWRQVRDLITEYPRGDQLLEGDEVHINEDSDGSVGDDSEAASSLSSDSADSDDDDDDDDAPDVSVKQTTSSASSGTGDACSKGGSTDSACGSGSGTACSASSVSSGTVVVAPPAVQAKISSTGGSTGSACGSGSGTACSASSMSSSNVCSDVVVSLDGKAQPVQDLEEELANYNAMLAVAKNGQVGKACIHYLETRHDDVRRRLLALKQKPGEEKALEDMNAQRLKLLDQVQKLQHSIAEEDKEKKKAKKDQKSEKDKKTKKDKKDKKDKKQKDGKKEKKDKKDKKDKEKKEEKKDKKDKKEKEEKKETKGIVACSGSGTASASSSCSASSICGAIMASPIALVTSSIVTEHARQQQVLPAIEKFAPFPPTPFPFCSFYFVCCLCFHLCACLSGQ